MFPARGESVAKLQVLVVLHGFRTGGSRQISPPLLLSVRQQNRRKNENNENKYIKQKPH
jgi:hypothetical protein